MGIGEVLSITEVSAGVWELVITINIGEIGTAYNGYSFQHTLTTDLAPEGGLQAFIVAAAVTRCTDLLTAFGLTSIDKVILADLTIITP